MNKQEQKYRLKYYNLVNRANETDYSKIPARDKVILDSVEYRLIYTKFILEDLKENPKLSQNQIANKYGISRGKARKPHELFHKVLAVTQPS